MTSEEGQRRSRSRGERNTDDTIDDVVGKHYPSATFQRKVVRSKSSGNQSNNNSDMKAFQVLEDFMGFSCWQFFSILLLFPSTMASTDACLAGPGGEKVVEVAQKKSMRNPERS